MAKAAVAVLFVLLLAACSGLNRNPNAADPYAKYYTGTQGVVTSFQSMPTKLWYYGPEDNSGNEFSFTVETANKGASFTRGGIYLSGFDPNLIHIDGIDLKSQPQACGISISHIGFGDLGAIVQCDNFKVAAQEGAGITNFDLKDLGKIIYALSEKHDKKWLDPKFDIDVSYAEGNGGTVNFKFNDLQNRLDYYQHGRLFIYVLSGINFEAYNGHEFLLAGDTYEFPGGELDFKNYQGKIIDWPPGKDQIDQHLMLTTCYQYTTYAAPMVCMDPDPASDVRKVCVPQSRTWNGGNGAPVAITSIEQENTPKKVIFRINVKNVGAGTVYDPGKLEKCSPYYPGRVLPEDLNVVYLGDVRIGQTGLQSRGGEGGMTCYPEVIRLDPKTKAGSTTCTYPIQYFEAKSAYETPLTVELWYGYSDTLLRTITIKRVT